MIPSNIGLIVPSNGVYPSDLPFIQQFSWVFLIATWPQETDEAISILHSIPIKYIRYMNDPSQWISWPQAHLNLSPRAAVFSNEPDIEGPPQDWCSKAENLWASYGGKLIEPAWSDDSKAPRDVYDPRAQSYPNHYDIHSAHCYANNFTNANSVAARCNDGRPVIISEYGHAFNQSKVIEEVIQAHLAQVNDIALFTLRFVGNQQAGYDLANTQF